MWNGEQIEYMSASQNMSASQYLRVSLYMRASQFMMVYHYMRVYQLEVALGIPNKKNYPRATLVRKFILVQESEIVYPSLNTYLALPSK